MSAAHLLHLTGIDEGMASWALTCIHDEPWPMLDEDGQPTRSEGFEGVCWLWEWFDNTGAEMLDVHLTFSNGSIQMPCPVRPSDDWDYDNGGTLVLDTETQ